MTTCKNWSRFVLEFEINGMARKKFAKSMKPTGSHYELKSHDQWILYHRNMILYNLCNIVNLIGLQKKTGIENRELKEEILNSENEIKIHCEQKALFENELVEKQQDNCVKLSNELEIFNFAIPKFLELIERLKQMTEIQNDVRNDFENVYKLMFDRSIGYNININININH